MSTVKTQSPDTERSAEMVLIDLLRKKSVSEKFNQVRSLSRVLMRLSKRAITRAGRTQSETEADLLFVELNYGGELAERMQRYLRTSQHERSGSSTSGKTDRRSL
jgi:hypothetical protein